MIKNLSVNIFYEIKELLKEGPAALRGGSQAQGPACAVGAADICKTSLSHLVNFWSCVYVSLGNYASQANNKGKHSVGKVGGGGESPPSLWKKKMDLDIKLKEVKNHNKNLRKIIKNNDGF